MKLLLDSMQLSWIESRLNKRLPSDFVGDSLQSLIDSAKALKAEKEACLHTRGKYIGEKECCTKCESFFEPGCHESWRKDGV